MAVENKILGGEFMEHVFKGGVSAFHNALTLRFVGDAELVGNAKFGQEILEFGRGVSWAIV